VFVHRGSLGSANTMRLSSDVSILVVHIFMILYRTHDASLTNVPEWGALTSLKFIDLGICSA
jgi:hypothetical protein